MTGFPVLLIIALQIWAAIDIAAISLPTALFWIGCAVANFGIYLTQA